MGGRASCAGAPRCSPPEDLAALVAAAAEKGLLGEGDLARIAARRRRRRVSRGRSGELRDELRVEALEGDRRADRPLALPARRRPWELQEAPPMLPAARYAEALAGMSGARTAVAT